MGVTEVFTCESNSIFTSRNSIHLLPLLRLSGDALLQLELLQCRLLHFFFNASFAQHSTQQPTVLMRYQLHLHANSIRHIPPCRFTRTDNFDHLTPFHTIISSHWIIRLNTGELCFAKAVPLQQLLLLI